MALVVLKSGKAITISPKKGAIIWYVWNGERNGTIEQREFVKNIRHLFLNKHNAPESYLKRYNLVKPKAPELVQARLPYKD